MSCDNICWTKFSRIDGISFTKRDFCETLDGGQAFRWKADETSPVPQYSGIFGENVARVKLDADGSVWESHQIGNSNGAKAVREYLDAETDYAQIRASLEACGDSAMSKALKIYPTLRILRQSPAEAIICFICSSSKRIVQIKQCVGNLAEKLGEKIDGNAYKLPDFATLAEAPIETIIDCKLGFRAQYLKKSAKKIVADKFEPMSLREMPYEDAKKYLTSLTGIGEKVADCILLFGASRFEAFPVDTWIRQAMTELYNTPDDPKQIRSFAAKRFGGLSGFAQQLIFAAKRNNLI